MPLKFSNPDDDPPGLPRHRHSDPGAEPLIKPRPYSPNAIRGRMFVLMAMLLLVVVAMNEAGKPENWAWMGFEDDKIEIDANDLSAEVKERSGSEVEPSGTRSAPEKATGGVAGSTISLVGADPQGSQPESQLEVDYPSVAARFWQELFPQLESSQQKLLFDLTSLVRSETRPGRAVQVPDLENLLQLVSDQRDQFHQSLFDQITLMPDSASGKSELSQAYYESEECWGKQVLPAFKAQLETGEVTLAQQQSIFRLQRLLDQLAMRLVVDRTALGWAGDSMTWTRVWERVGQLDGQPAEPVSRLQLMSQPQVYRGKLVQVEGWARAARKETLGPESKLGVPHYYELWLRPEDTKVGPYCVYCAQLPPGFPEPDDKFQDVNERVSIRGLFFKVRSYVAGDSSVAYAPVIVSPTPEPVVVAQPYTAVDRWQPSWGVWIGMICAIPLIAIGLAWWAFRTSETSPYRPGEVVNRSIHRSLDDLKDDPDIKTDLERVRELDE